MSTRQTPSAYFLIADERAEVVKDLTISLRGLFADCLVEAVYSRPDLMYVVARREWDILLVDEGLIEPASHTLADLRRYASASALLVIGDREDWQWAQRLLSQGTDSYLCRRASSFATQLLTTTKLLLERRRLAARLERSEHYLGLIEQLSDVVYELDPMGRFLHVSPAVTPLLGYQPADLIGQPYTILLAGEDHARAAGHVNERRTGDRATKNFELRMLGKSAGAPAHAPVEVELNAIGLYGPEQEFLGTVGLLKDARRLTTERDRIRTLERQIHDNQQDREAAQAFRQAAERYRDSLSGLSTEAGDLLNTLQSLKLEARLGRMQEQAAHTLEGAPPERGTAAPAAHPVSTGAPSSVELASTERGQAVPPPPPVPLRAEPSPAPVVPPSTDRRRAPRLACSLPTKIHFEGHTWDGTTRDVGLGGMLVTTSDLSLSEETHPAQVSLDSGVGVLELRGIIRATREWEEPHRKDAERPATGLAIEFGPFGPYEEQILDSMLQGISDQTIQLQATVTIQPVEADGRVDLAEETRDRPDDDEPSLGQLGSGLSPERRLDERANTVLQVRLEPCGPSVAMPALSGRTSNVSVSGCCLSIQATPGIVRTRAWLTFLPPSGGAARGSKQGRQAITMLAEILWAAPDTGVVAEAREQDPPPFRVGLRFLHTDRHSEQRMRDVMARLLPNGDSEIVTVAAECSNDAGQRLAIAHDHPRKALPPGSPVVIISPGFGETKRAWVGLAHWLCVNGFHVLRYDHTCHVGDSDGPMERTTLSGMQQDLRAVLDLAERLLPASPLAVIGHNLSGRVALKVASTDPRIKLLFLLAGVVDVQSTLMAVHQDDLVAGYRSGARLGRANLLGFTIDADRWLGDATGGRFCSMDDTLADAERMQAPVIFLAAEKDPWVPLEQLKAVQSALRSNRRHLSLLVGSPSRLRDNPRTARAFFRQIAACCIERFYPLTPKGQVLPADPAPAARQAERERIRSRQRHSLAKPDLVDFWQIYLDHFQTAARSSEFWRLYDHLYRLLGTTDKGGTILDAGCGHGVFGMLLSLNHAYRHRTAAEGTPWSTTYVGLDVVPAALQHASRQLALVADEVRQKFPTTRYPHVLVRSALMAGDLDQPLPFRDGQFDRIVCNLTLSFLRDPVSTLRELMRTLTPGGRLVVSLFTPHADLSAVFATVMQRATGAEEIEEAKWLWTQWGLIREAEANGAFRFFDRPEAIRLFKACGAPRPRLYPALADQALIVVAEKSMR